jgi:hypothetical protein
MEITYFRRMLMHLPTSGEDVSVQSSDILANWTLRFQSYHSGSSSLPRSAHLRPFAVHGTSRITSEEPA